MSPTLTTFLYEAANFLVLAAALGWLFFRPVRKALADRQQRFAAKEHQAAEQLAQAQQAQQEAAAERANLQTELSALRAQELEAARQKADKILAEARASAARELESSRRQAAHLSESQQDTLSVAAATAAAEAVQQLMKQIGGPDVHAALVASACHQLAALQPESLAPVKIESEQALSAEAQAALNEALRTAAASADYRQVEDMGVGIRVTTAQGLIDASASGLARFARQALLQEMSLRSGKHNSFQIANHE